MSREEIVKWTCDLCGTSCSDQNKCRSSWVKITLDDKFEDRVWHDKHICPSCYGEIKLAAKKK